MWVIGETVADSRVVGESEREVEDVQNMVTDQSEEKFVVGACNLYVLIAISSLLGL